MVSTKELVYFLGIVLFLILGISITVFLKSPAGSGLFSKSSTSLELATVTEAVLEQEVVEGDEKKGFSREENLKNMRAKIASNPNLIEEAESSPLFIPKEPSEDSRDDEKNDEEVVLGKINTCSEQINLENSWVATGVSFSELGSLREVIRTDLNTGEGKTVAWLPTFKSANGGENCLNSSVVGIALDGSLIKNDENGLYSIFSKETLLGYARDGFPIYGLNDGVKTDKCGGINEGGQYRYYLSSDRDGVLGCFSASPVNSLGG